MGVRELVHHTDIHGDIYVGVIHCVCVFERCCLYKLCKKREEFEKNGAADCSIC